MSVTIHIIHTRLAQAYLIENDHGLYLVDTGEPGAGHRIVETIQRLGCKDLRLIFLTHAHFDHAGSAAELKIKTGAPIAIHRADAVDLATARTTLGTSHGRGRLASPFVGLVNRFFRPHPVLADLLLEDGASLEAYGLAAFVLHTPGHTKGSCSLIVENHLAFVGDLLSTTGRPRLQPYYAQDWSMLPDSLERLLAYQPAWVYTGHGRPAARDELVTILR